MEALTNPLVLALPQATGCYSLETDACDIQVKSVLLQENQMGPVDQSIISLVLPVIVRAAEDNGKRVTRFGIRRATTAVMLRRKSVYRKNRP